MVSSTPPTSSQEGDPFVWAVSYTPPQSGQMQRYKGMTFGLWAQAQAEFEAAKDARQNISTESPPQPANAGDHRFSWSVTWTVERSYYHPGEYTSYHAYGLTAITGAYSEILSQETIQSMQESGTNGQLDLLSGLSVTPLLSSSERDSWRSNYSMSGSMEAVGDWAAVSNTDPDLASIFLPQATVTTFWLDREDVSSTEARAVPVEKTYLLLKEQQTHNPADGTTSTVLLGTPEVVKLRIAPGDIISRHGTGRGAGGVVHLVALPTEDYHVKIVERLVPIEVLQPADGTTQQGALQKADEIRLCRWFDNESYGDEVIKLQPFPEKDADRIVVRIPLPHKKGETGLTIKVSTEGGDSAHNDNPTKIDLNETAPNSGVFESLPFVVVADVDDDNAKTGVPGGGSDNTTNDRTHMGQAGGTLVVECEALGTTPIKVPIRKNTHYFEVTSIILDIPGDDVELAPAVTKMESQAEWMIHAYKPYGIEARHTYAGAVTIDSTSKQTLYDLLKDKQIGVSNTGPNTEASMILADASISSLKAAKNIVLVYVNADLLGASGDAVGAALTGTWEGYVLMSAKQLMSYGSDPARANRKLYTAAHECGHVHGLQHLYHPSDGSAAIAPPKFNFMRDGNTRHGREPQDAGMSGRRLLREQLNSIRGATMMQPIE